MGSFPLRVILKIGCMKGARDISNNGQRLIKNWICLQPDGNIRFNVHVRPGAKVSKLADISDSFINMQIAAPPREGEANEEVIRYISELFRLKPRNFELVAGHKSRDKVILMKDRPEHLMSVEQISLYLSQQLTTTNK